MIDLDRGRMRIVSYNEKVIRIQYTKEMNIKEIELSNIFSQFFFVYFNNEVAGYL